MKIINLLLSTLMAMFSSSWVTLWMFLEMNNLCMCTILSNSSNKEKSSKETTLVYFVIQALASIMLLCVMMSNINTTEKTTLAIIVLMMKMGVWPSHIWYMKTISSLKFGGAPMILLMTVQKIIPLILMTYMMNEEFTMLVMTLTLSNMMISTLWLSSKKSLKSIMGVSSLYYNSWLILSATTYWCLLTFFIIYMPTLIITMVMMKKVNTKNSMTWKKFWPSSMIIMNLSGLPPMMMFTAKIYTTKTLLWLELPELAMFMLMTSCLFTYHYMWSTMKVLNVSSKKTQMIETKEPKALMLTAALMSTLGLVSILMMLGLTVMGITLM